MEFKMSFNLEVKENIEKEEYEEMIEAYKDNKGIVKATYNDLLEWIEENLSQNAIISDYKLDIKEEN